MRVWNAKTLPSILREKIREELQCLTSSNKLSTGDGLQGGDKEQLLQLCSYSWCISCV